MVLKTQGGGHREEARGTRYHRVLLTGRAATTKSSCASIDDVRVLVTDGTLRGTAISPASPGAPSIHYHVDAVIDRARRCVLTLTPVEGRTPDNRTPLTFVGSMEARDFLAFEAGQCGRALWLTSHEEQGTFPGEFARRRREMAGGAPDGGDGPHYHPARCNGDEPTSEGWFTDSGADGGGDGGGGK